MSEMRFYQLSDRLRLALYRSAATGWQAWAGDGWVTPEIIPEELEKVNNEEAQALLIRISAARGITKTADEAAGELA